MHKHRILVGRKQIPTTANNSRNPGIFFRPTCGRLTHRPEAVLWHPAISPSAHRHEAVPNAMQVIWGQQRSKEFSLERVKGATKNPWISWIMGVKQCHKPPILLGMVFTYKKSDDWGMVPLWHWVLPTWLGNSKGESRVNSIGAKDSPFICLRSSIGKTILKTKNHRKQKTKSQISNFYFDKVFTILFRKLKPIDMFSELLFRGVEGGY